MEIQTWGRNTSGSFAALKKIRYLKYVDNKDFEVLLLLLLWLSSYSLYRACFKTRPRSSRNSAEVSQ